MKSRPHSSHPSLQLLDCLRCTHLSCLPSINKTILWVAPSAQYAAAVVRTIKTISLLTDHPLQPHFWPVQRSSVLHSATTHGFLYRVCNLFASIDTKLILVFPEGSHEDDLKNAINGSLSQWSNFSLIIYNSVVSTIGCTGPLIYRTAACTEDMLAMLRRREEEGVDSWSNDEFGEMEKELCSYDQMMWLGKLLHEIENERRDNVRSEWLVQLGWDVSSETLTDYQHHILRENLKDWESGNLRKYLIDTHLWSCDDTSLVGVVPGHCIIETVQQTVSLHPPRLPDQLKFIIEESSVDCYPEAIRQATVPTLLTSGTVPAHLTTPTFNRLAAQRCCRLTVESLLMHLKKIVL